MRKTIKLCRVFVFAIGLCLSGNAQANDNEQAQSAAITQQGNTLNGNVQDQLGPIIGVSVAVKGTSNGSITDSEGKFTLRGVSKGDVIRISFVGYIPQEITYTGQAILTVTLVEDTQALDEVVVTALGIKREKKTLGYAIQDLSGETLVETREQNVINALSGKVAGLQVIKSSGMGASSKIVLRGNTSVTGDNQPLIVVDGIPISNFNGGKENSMWGSRNLGNGLADINPEDIESMSVLKGGSAAALYGSRAGNGVILITTKVGKKQDGLGINISSSLTLESIFLKPELQNQFGQGNRGVSGETLQTSTSWGPQVETYDNINAYFNTGHTYTENVSFQQTVGKTSVYTSINRNDNGGMTPNTSINTTSLLTHITTNLGESNKWKLDAMANYINHQGNNLTMKGIIHSNPFWSIYLMPRSVNVKDYENNYLDDYGDMKWYTKDAKTHNPYWEAYRNLNSETRNRLLGNVSLSYDLTDWLSAEVKAGTDNYTTSFNRKLYAGGNNDIYGGYEEKITTFYENNFSSLITAHKSNLISQLSAVATLGGSLMSQNDTYLRVAPSGGLNVPNFFNLKNGRGVSPDIEYVPKPQKINSIYGSASLDWDNYVFLDVTLRNDWASTMSKENRSFLYPSVSVSGVISDMVSSWGGSLPVWLSFAKIRGSYAEIGNPLEPFQLYNTYNLEKDGNGNSMVKNNNVYYDPNVVNELIKTMEFGADIRFFQNRLGLDVAWYRRNATNQLLDVSMDPSSGFNQKKINAGDIQNQGWELLLNGTIFDNPNNGFEWKALANISSNENKIIALTPGIARLELGSMDNNRIFAVEGGGYGDIYGNKIKRNDAGQIIVSSEGLPLAVEDQYIGNQQPDWMLGITNNFSYKGVNLSFSIDGRFGGKIFSASTAIMSDYGVAAGTLMNGGREDFVVPNSVNENGTPNTTKINVQDYWQNFSSNGAGNTGWGEVYSFDATNIRLRNVSLGYQFSKKQLKKTPFTKLGISLSSNNVWMIHYNLPGVDPESVYATKNDTGFEMLSSTSSRTFTFNINVGF